MQGLDLDTIWEIPADATGGTVYLPVLRGLAGQDGRLPDHPAGFIRGDADITLTLSADKTTLPYDGGARTAALSVVIGNADAVSDRTVLWSHNGGEAVTEAKSSNTEYTLDFPADYGGEVTVTAVMKGNRAVSDAITLTVYAPVHAGKPVIERQPQDTPALVDETVTLSVAVVSPDGEWPCPNRKPICAAGQRFLHGHGDRQGRKYGGGDVCHRPGAGKQGAS